jgi:hypothetical protein
LIVSIRHKQIEIAIVVVVGPTAGSGPPVTGNYRAGVNTGEGFARRGLREGKRGWYKKKQRDKSC